MTFENLYPPGFDQYEVAPRVPAPRRPAPPSGAVNRTTARQYYGENYLQEYRFAAGKAPIAIIDKAFPHSRFDCMLLAADDLPRSGVTDLEPESRRFLFQVAAAFEDFVQATDSVDGFDPACIAIHATFNFNAAGHDRENSMFYDKRFHLHLNAFPAEDRQGIGTCRYGHLADRAQRYQIADPISFLAPAVIAEASGGRLGGLRCYAWPVTSWPDVLPGGLYLPLPSWRDLAAPAFEAALIEQHELVHRVHGELSQAFTGHPEPPGTWLRHRLLPPAEVRAALEDLGWLTEPTRGLLSSLRAQLRDVDAEDLTRFRSDPARAVTQLAISTVDYSVSVVPVRSLHPQAARWLGAAEACAVFNYRLFSDVGGAGLPPLPGSYLAKLDRKAGPLLTEPELRQRADFREAFVASIIEPLAAGHGAEAGMAGGRR